MQTSQSREELCMSFMSMANIDLSKNLRLVQFKFLVLTQISIDCQIKIKNYIYIF